MYYLAFQLPLLVAPFTERTFQKEPSAAFTQRKLSNNILFICSNCDMPRYNQCQCHRQYLKRSPLLCLPRSHGPWQQVVPSFLCILFLNIENYSNTIFLNLWLFIYDFQLRLELQKGLVKATFLLQNFFIHWFYSLTR